MEAYPPPDTYSFIYLGTSQNSEGSSQPDTDLITLRAVCNITPPQLFEVTCNVSVLNVEDSTVEGFYLFTAGNDFGEGSFKFQVQFYGNNLLFVFEFT